MRTIIDSETTLADLLFQHTGSKRITYDLRHWALGYVNSGNIRYGSDVSYRTYSRGKSTMMFGKDDGKCQSFLVDVWPKVTWKAYQDGIDWNLLQSLMPLMQTGSKIVGRWGCALTIQIVGPDLTEQQIEDFFKLGFNEYMCTTYTGPILIMK